METCAITRHRMSIPGASPLPFFRPAPRRARTCAKKRRDLRQAGKTCTKQGRPAPSRTDLHKAGQTCIRQDRLASGRTDLHQAGQTCIRQGRLASGRADLHQAGQTCTKQDRLASGRAGICMTGARWFRCQGRWREEKEILIQGNGIAGRVGAGQGRRRGEKEMLVRVWLMSSCLRSSVKLIQRRPSISFT